MERVESYIHTRNYGCRMRRYLLNGVDMLSLENQCLKVVLALGKGADIVELVYKPMDIDFMWHSFNELKNINHISSVASKTGNFLDSYSGGWQELFPVYGGYTTYHGSEQGVHGEACLYPWECQTVTDTPECVEVALSLRTIRSPFLLEKRVKLLENDPTLYIQQKVTNLGSREMDFMWGHHPAFGFPFLDKSVELRLKGSPHVKVPAHTIVGNCPFDRETEGTWPLLSGKDGTPVDMSRARGAEEKVYLTYAVSDLEEGAYELVNRDKALGIRMCWDRSVFPYLWVWGLYCGLEAYPWYGRSYVMAVEPWSSMPGNYEQAKNSGTLLHLAPGESLETAISAQIIPSKDMVKNPE